MISRNAIFGLMEELIENEISVIPTMKTWDKSKNRFSGKACKITNWQEFSDRLTTSKDIDQWRNNGQVVGIGVVLGTASNLVAIDIDCDDAEILAGLPRSPCVKRGEKGETRFFRMYDQYDARVNLPTSNMRKFSRPGKKTPDVEIFYSKRYTVIPPSLHSQPEDGDPMYFKWLFEDLATVDKDALPVLDWQQTEATAERLCNRIGKYAEPDKPLTLIHSENNEDGGRFQDMQTFMSSLARNKTPMDEAVDEIMERDRVRNKFNPLMTDTEKYAKHQKTGSLRLTTMSIYIEFLQSIGQGKNGHEIEVPTPSNFNYFIENEDWERPTAIRDGGGKVEFDVDIIPDTWNEWIQKTARNMGVDPGPMFMYALTGLSSVIGNKVKIKPKKNDPWSEAANIWTLFVAKSGRKKSSISSLILSILEEIDKEGLEEKKKLAVKVIEMKSIAKLKVRKINKELSRELDEDTPSDEKLQALSVELAVSQSIVDEPLKCESFIAQVVTPEKLFQIFDSNPHGVLMYFNEASTLLDQFNKKGYELMRTLVMNSWDGNKSFTYQTKTQESNMIEELCGSLIANIQPSVLHSRIINDLKRVDDGFVQRAFIVFDEEKKHAIVDDVCHNKLLEKAKGPFFQGSNLEPGEEIKLSENAYIRMMAYLEEIEERVLAEENDSIASFVGKFRGLAVKLAYLIQFVSTNIAFSDIELPYLEKAIKLLDYNYQNINHAFKAPFYDISREISDHFRTGKIEMGITVRDFGTYHKRLYGDRHQWKAVREILEDHNIIKIRKEGKSFQIVPNPMLYK